MKYLAIVTTVLFSGFSFLIPEHLYPITLVTCASYILWGAQYYIDKKFTKIETDPELNELSKNLKKFEMESKMAELNRHNAAQEAKFAIKKEQEKNFNRGIQW